MKVFIGIPADPTIKNKYSKIKNKLGEYELRWENPDDLHLTIIPPWYTDHIPSEVKNLKIIQKLVKPFQIKLNKVCFAPNKRKMQLLWAQGEASDNLILLKRNLEKIFPSKETKRKLIPHITLAHSKKNLDLLSFKINWVQNVNSIALFESHKVKNDKKYEIVKHVKI